jgi:hypothetical protein
MQEPGGADTLTILPSRCLGLLIGDHDRPRIHIPHGVGLAARCLESGGPMSVDAIDRQ